MQPKRTPGLSERSRSSGAPFRLPPVFHEACPTRRVYFRDALYEAIFARELVLAAINFPTM